MALAVMDASVAVKWFLEEPDGDSALELRSDFFEGILTLRVPAVLPYEIMNALRYSRRFRHQELREAAKDLDRCGFTTVPLFGEYLDRTVVIALETETSIYDASYLALAEIQGCPLFTADTRLVALSSDSRQVIHIRDYRTAV